MGLPWQESGKEQIKAEPWTLEEAELEGYKAGLRPWEFWEFTLRELTAFVYARYDANNDWFGSSGLSSGGTGKESDGISLESGLDLLAE